MKRITVIAAVFGTLAFAPQALASNPPSDFYSTVSASPSSVVANGSSTSVVTVQLEDDFNHNLTQGGDIVQLSLNIACGSLSANGTSGTTNVLAHDNGNGSYSATYTAPLGPCAQQVEVSATVDLMPLFATGAIYLVAGAPSTFELESYSPTSIPADGASTVFLHGSAFDSYGNEVVPGPGLTLQLTSTLGTVYNINGLTATLQAGTSAGCAVIGMTANGSALTPKVSHCIPLTANMGDFSGSSFNVCASWSAGGSCQNPAFPSSSVTTPTNTATVTLTLKDRYANLIGPWLGGNVALGPNVTFTSSCGTLSNSGSSGNPLTIVPGNYGVYTAILSGASGQSCTVSATVGGGSIPATASVTFS